VLKKNMLKLITTIAILFIATAGFTNVVPGRETYTVEKVIEGDSLQLTNSEAIVEEHRDVNHKVKNEVNRSNAMLSNVSTEALVLYNTGVVQIQNLQYNEAIKTLKKVISMEPDFSEAYFNLGGAYNSLGKRDDSIVNLKKALKINPSNVNLHIYLSGVYVKQKQYELANNYLRKALEIDSKNSVVHAQLGAGYYMLKEFDMALPYLEKAITIQPNNLAADSHLENLTYAILTDTYLELGKNQKAEETANEAININPKYSLSLLNIANKYGIKGKKDEMITTLEKATDLNPEFVTGYILLSAAYIAKGIKNKKRIDVQKARENAIKAKKLLERMGGPDSALQSINKRLIEFDEFESKLDD
jgi:tetratricopeptide (TPR) repeat protein